MQGMAPNDFLPRGPHFDSADYSANRGTTMTDATSGDDPKTVQIELRLSEAFLEDIDHTWKEQGFDSRNEFLRHAARDAVDHPEFSRESWKQIAATEHELRTGDGEFVSREDVLELMDRDEG